MKKLLLTLLLVLTTSVANAWDYIDWDTKDKGALTYHTVTDQENVNNSITHVYTSSDEHSLTGTQRIYFEYFILGDDRITACNQEFTIGEQTRIWQINGQSVKMSYKCFKLDHPSYDTNIVKVTPYSNAGLDYVINEFKKSPDYVWASNGRFNIRISAKGFTKVWNNAGGNAL